MTRYDYRWLIIFIASIIIVIVDLICAVKPKLIAIRVAQVELQQLQQQLLNLQLLSLQGVTLTKQKKPLHDLHVKTLLHTDKLAPLYTLAHVGGVSIQFFDILGKRSLSFLPTEVELAHVTVKGNYYQLLSFLFSLTRNFDHILVTDFDYKRASKMQDSLKLTIVFLPSMLDSMQAKEMNEERLELEKYNPFCFSKYETSIRNDPNQLLHFPLQQIKMLGYFQQNNTSYALVKLPTGAIFDIGIGEVIGLEQGRLDVIEKNKLVFSVNKIEKRILVMEVDND